MDIKSGLIIINHPSVEADVIASVMIFVSGFYIGECVGCHVDGLFELCHICER
jgi:hypothetical protein